MRKTFLLLTLAMVFLSFVGRTWADGPNDYLHSRTYIGILGTSVSVGNQGEFTGLNYSRVDTPSYEITLIPSLAQNFGYGVLVGHREESYALELSYWESQHIATFGQGTIKSNDGSALIGGSYQETAVYRSVNVDFKKYFLTNIELQPFLDLGVSFPWIDIPYADTDGQGRFYQATLAGLGFDLGIGVEYYLSPTLSLVGGAYQRWASFDEFKGFNTQFAQLMQYGNPTSDEGSGLIFSVGTTLGFE
jgi:hypothetical protein